MAVRLVGNMTHHKHRLVAEADHITYPGRLTGGNAR